MSNPFFDHPILNSPYQRPSRHWELDELGQPTQQVLETRRRAEFITPIPKPKKQKKTPKQEGFIFDEGQGLSGKAQQYDPTSIINEVRTHVDAWRALPNPNQWQVTPETARLLQHWRHHKFNGVRPFFCQVEAVETAIWLTEVAPGTKHGKRLLDHLAAANKDAKLPRVPVADNIPGNEMPMFRNLWEHIRAKMPKKGRNKADVLNPLDLPTQLQTALEALYGHYEKTFELWAKEKISVPPCFIIVCNNTSASKLVYDYISGFQRANKDGTTQLEFGRLPLFRNHDEHGNPLGRPRTLLIDSEQLESGEALDDAFHTMAADEIARFRRELVERTGDPQAGANMTDQDLLREAMNTVGKAGRLGDSIRCVVSVSMLTEGWDANTVTHVLGIRAFGTQLLCEQVIGRALRRQSYELNEEDLFNVEYADVLGIPFDFNAKPVIAPPQKPRETIQVKAVRPERDALEIRFPRVQGYRTELPEERLTADFNNDSTLEINPEMVGATETRNSGIIGAPVDLNLAHTGDVRQSQVIYELTSHLLLTRFRDDDGEPQLHLFGQLKRIVREWLDAHLVCKGRTYPAQLKYKMLADMACERINAAITRALMGKRPILALLDPYNPVGSTRHVRFNTSKAERWLTSAQRCHINWVVLDSDWEAEFCRVAEAHPQVRAYVKNHGLGFEVPYRYGSEMRSYLPDFIVRVDDGKGPEDPLHLIVEIKGYRREDAKEKKSTMDTYWVPGVNHLGTHGRWAFAEFTDVFQMQDDFAKKVEAEFAKMIDGVVGANR